MQGEYYTIPRFFNPSKKAFEELGFKIEVLEEEEIMGGVILPEGWNIKKNEFAILDEKGRKRARWFYKSLIYGKEEGKTELLCRYSITIIKIGTLWCGMAHDWNGEIFFEIRESDKEKVYEQVKKYLEENFPNWEDPTKYWD